MPYILHPLHERRWKNVVGIIRFCKISQPTKMLKGNHGGVTFRWITKQNTMLYTQKYTPPHLPFLQYQFTSCDRPEDRSRLTPQFVMTGSRNTVLHSMQISFSEIGSQNSVLSYINDRERERNRNIYGGAQKDDFRIVSPRHNCLFRSPTRVFAAWTPGTHTSTL